MRFLPDAGPACNLPSSQRGAVSGLRDHQPPYSVMNTGWPTIRTGHQLAQHRKTLHASTGCGYAESCPWQCDGVIKLSSELLLIAVDITRRHRKSLCPWRSRGVVEDAPDTLAEYGFLANLCRWMPATGNFSGRRSCGSVQKHAPTSGFCARNSEASISTAPRLNDGNSSSRRQALPAYHVAEIIGETHAAIFRDHRWANSGHRLSCSVGCPRRRPNRASFGSWACYRKNSCSMTIHHLIELSEIAACHLNCAWAISSVLSDYCRRPFSTRDRNRSTPPEISLPERHATAPPRDLRPRASRRLRPAANARAGNCWRRSRHCRAGLVPRGLRDALVRSKSGIRNLWRLPPVRLASDINSLQRIQSISASLLNSPSPLYLPSFQCPPHNSPGKTGSLLRGADPRSDPLANLWNFNGTMPFAGSSSCQQHKAVFFIQGSNALEETPPRLLP